MSMDENAERLARIAQGWNEAAAGYEAYWVPRFAPWVHAAVDALVASPLPDGPILVPCCGTFPELDELIRHFPDREVVGIDLSSGMVGMARERAAPWPNVTVVEGDASTLDPRWTDVCAGVLSVFGLQQLPSPSAALRSWSAALRPGGRLSVVYWPDVAEVDGPFAAVRNVVNPSAGDTPAPDGSANAVESAGLTVERDDDLAFEITHPSAARFIDAYTESGPMRALAISRGPAYIDDVRLRFLRGAPSGEWRHRPKGHHIVAHR